MMGTEEVVGVNVKFLGDTLQKFKSLIFRRLGNGSAPLDEGGK